MLRTVILAIVLTSCIMTSGCWQRSINSALYSPWNNTELGVSNSAQVLSLLQNPKTEARGELISQSDTVAGSWGQANSGKKQWLNVSAFDEQNAVAVRKYFFFVDEDARTWLFIHPKWSVQFNAQLAGDPAVLEKAYPNENARRIAFLEYVLKSFQEDIRKIQQDNKMIGTCRDTVNAAFTDILTKLKEQPARAADLTMPRGMEYVDPAFYHGRIEFSQHRNIITVVIKSGAIADSHFLSHEPSTESAGLKPPETDTKK